MYIILSFTHAVCVSGTGEGATSGGRAESSVNLNQNISYCNNTVMLQEDDELHSTTTPSGPSSQITANHVTNDEPQASEEESEPCYANIMTVMESHSNAECDIMSI